MDYMDNKKVEIGHRIREIRQSLRLDQKQFGVRIGGKSKSAVSKYESGEAYPPLDTLEIIASVGEKPLEWIVKGEIKTAPSDETTFHREQLDSGLRKLAESLEELPPAEREAEILRMRNEILEKVVLRLKRGENQEW